MTEERKAPAIRFKEFSDQNAEAWEQRKLGDISTSFSGGTPAVGNKRYYGGEIPFIRSAEIKSDSTELFLTNEGLENSSAKLVKKGDILYALYGATSGEVDISKINGAINQAILCIVPKINYNSGFIMQWLKYQKKNITDKYLQGGQGNLSGTLVKELDISLPTPPEQRAIGNFFQDLDKLITLQQRKLEILKEQKKTYLKLLSPAKGQKKPVLRFAEFEDEWKEVKVSDIFKVTRGQVLATTEISEEKTDTHKYPVYSSQTKNEGLLGYYDKYLFETAITWTTDGANAGTVNYREGKFYSTNVNGVLLSDEGFANKVIAEILNNEAWKYVSKVGNPKLMNNVMSEISLVIPNDFREISILSSLFQDLDKFIALQQRRLDKLQNMKKALLEQMMM
ncbi:restriction endonuclease subunit S [Streptococcus oralis]|uniref:Type I restriction-modification system, specificity subunit S n=1 Tax=Streptococcus oralis TaxID=1303 RepID=A0A139R215_STROR|nr:restriction endonuclease subunit S [Streptococcus oralis]KXU08797.1 Type I restriction-modification system, specificity subunit S [Streptococcus oralis]